MKRPFFSIVIPTKDRPECVKIILESLKRQTYSDYEVIVSDNASDKPCKEIFDAVVNHDLNKHSFLYFKNERTLGICDSFEMAISHAHGEWVLLFGDKNILYPDALEKIHRAIEKEKPDIINYSQDYLKPIDAEKDLIYGKLIKVKKKGGTSLVNIQQALLKHFSCEHLFAGTEQSWYAGCIYSGGGYSRSFIEKIRLSHKSGRMFDGIIPDRYGAIEALCLAERVMWLDDNICIYGVYGKNTWSGTVKRGMESLRGFVCESRCDMDYSDKLFVPNLVASAYNLVASDYSNALSSARSSDDRFKEIHINKGYLAALIEEELKSVQNISDAVLKEQRNLLETYISQFDRSDMERLQVSRKQMAYAKTVQRKMSAYGLRPFADKWLRQGMFANISCIRKLCTMLEQKFSRNIIIVKDLIDIH